MKEGDKMKEINELEKKVDFWNDRIDAVNKIMKAESYTKEEINRMEYLKEQYENYVSHYSYLILMERLKNSDKWKMISTDVGACVHVFECD